MTPSETRELGSRSDRRLSARRSAHQLTDERFQMPRAYAGREGLRWYAVLAEVEISHAELEQRLRGRWTPVAKLHGVTVYRIDS